MAEPKTRVIVNILEEHFEELEFLWGQRQAALRSPEYTARELAELEERIEAHVQGLLVGGDATSPLVEEGLTADDPLVAFAAAYTLLRLNREAAAERVIQALLQADGPQLKGVRHALCHGPIELVLDQLRQAVDRTSAPVAVSAAEALAFHHELDAETGRLDDFLKDDNADVRQAAWRIVALLDSRWQA